MPQLLICQFQFDFSISMNRILIALGALTLNLPAFAANDLVWRGQYGYRDDRPEANLYAFSKGEVFSFIENRMYSSVGHDHCAPPLITYLGEQGVYQGADGSYYSEPTWRVDYIDGVLCNDWNQTTTRGAIWAYSIPVIELNSLQKPDSSCPIEFGNPIRPLSGSKRETVPMPSLPRFSTEVIYDSTRHFASGLPGSPSPSFGPFWNSNVHRRIEFYDSFRQAAHVIRGNGHITAFSRSGSNPPFIYSADADVRDKLVETPTQGFFYYDEIANAIERYDLNGRLLGINFAGGASLTPTYSVSSTPPSIAPASGYLLRVQDEFGRAVQFEYELPSGAPANSGGRVRRVLDAAGVPLAVSYTATGYLVSITWQDGQQRRFLYDDGRFPWALTGIEDEHSRLSSTFAYGASGEATSTSRAGGVESFGASYSQPPRVVMTRRYDPVSSIIYRSSVWQAPEGIQVALPTGGSTSLGTVSVVGAPKLTTLSQPAGSGCAASTSYFSHDANGNVVQRDDFNGSRVCSSYDLSRNLETVRVEGLANTQACSGVIGAGATLPASSRKVSSLWHPDWRLKTKVAEPGRTITNVYNGQPDPFNGNAVANCAPNGAVLPDGKPIVVLCKKVEQATTDADGSQGFGASPQAGVANRVWQWTYNQSGQVLTERDPVNNVTTTDYYADTTADHSIGDRQRVTNAKGHVTSYTKYNSHGLLLEENDPNGVVTVYTYDLRQRLTSAIVGGQATVYTYDPVGQLTRVTLPDASWVGYEYDDAHRQVAVLDSKGNRIDYTLDNAGNRIAENVKDPSGVLVRLLTRSVDALGRVQQTTGRN
jgi:YD repeat-containing protein